MSKLTLSAPMDLRDPPSFKVTKHTTSGTTEVYTLSGSKNGYGFSVWQGQVFDLGLVQGLKTTLEVTGIWIDSTKAIYADAKAGRLLDWLPRMLTGDDDLIGSSGNDGLAGYEGDDDIRGNNGNDTLEGGQGSDTLLGGQGNDSVLGGDGIDFLKGEQGNDTLLAGKGDDIIYAGLGSDLIDGSWGIDSVYASGTAGVTIDLARSGLQKIGTASATLISIENAGGTDGADRLFGTNGANRLWGNKGADVINARNGDDVLFSGGGNDTLIGGWGKDTFAFIDDGGEDVISDFTDGYDRIAFHWRDGDFEDIEIRGSGRDTLIRFNGYDITLKNVDHTQITERDFTFDVL